MWGLPWPSSAIDVYEPTEPTLPSAVSITNPLAAKLGGADSRTASRTGAHRPARERSVPDPKLIEFSLGSAIECSDVGARAGGGHIIVRSITADPQRPCRI